MSATHTVCNGHIGGLLKVFAGIPSKRSLVKGVSQRAGLFLLLTAASSVAGSAEEIKGAFGMTLGEVLLEEDPRIKGKGDSVGDAGLRLAFDPDHPFGALDEYHVRITPETRKVYRVTAAGTFQSASACEGELSALQEALAERYGVIDDNIGDAMVSSMTGSKVIRIGSSPHRIVAICVGLMRRGHDLTLSYIDDDLERRAKAERARMGQEGYGGEGL